MNTKVHKVISYKRKGEIKYGIIYAESPRCNLVTIMDAEDGHLIAIGKDEIKVEFESEEENEVEEWFED